MTRPSIIRADTLDLQDHEAPSAKDHPSHPAIGEQNPGVTGSPIAPHQAETLREVAHETAEAESRSPRVSWTNGKSNSTDDTASGHDQSEEISEAFGIDMYSHNQEDALAIAQNGGVSSTDDDDLDGDPDADLDDDLMDKISSSPSIEDEDIDFEFVYALHTFVATVEGQANATKGDTMVLLDDSNSYWWLVRVVKDSSIGYLPAEHIETPTERLARLNKHRNIDLSAAMLGDQAQKQKNSFKNIRIRRKTVAFAEPTYVDYSDFDYSTDDEDIEELFGSQGQDQQQRDQQQNGQPGQQQQQEQQRVAQISSKEVEQDAAAKVEPLKTRSPKENSEVETIREVQDDEEQIRDSEEFNEGKPEGPSRSRNGTVRNTDSFFKDDSVETKKITLTPNLLRDDNATRQSSDSTGKDSKSNAAMEKLERELVSDKDKKKTKEKDKKDKDKKSGGLRGFFSRKDKKKTAEDDDESFGKRSMDIMSDPRDSEDRSVDEPLSPERNVGVQRQPSKLQKAAPVNKAAAAAAAQKSVELSSYLAENRTNDVSNVPPASMRIVDPDTQEAQEVPSNQHQPQDKQRERSASASTQKEDKSVISKLVTRSASTGQDIKPQKTVKAKTRMELDASDSSDVGDLTADRAAPVASSLSATESTPTELGRSQPDKERVATTANSRNVDSVSPVQTNMGAKEWMSENTEHSPAVHGPNPPALMNDTSSPEAVSPETSPSPELIQQNGDFHRGGSSASQNKEPAWDDSKLRAFFDEREHIRDLLAVVYDKSDVEPAGHDHPVVGGLFREQNAKLAEITTQLDNMLGDWLARKQRLRGTI